MAAIVVGLLLIGAVELVVIVAVAHAISWVSTLLALIVVSAVGAWIVKREGTATWRRVLSGVRAGHMPTNAVLDGCLAVVAGFLLLVPGFLTDVLALALLVPPVRKVVRARTADHFQKRIVAQVGRVRTTTVFGFGDPTDVGGTGGFGPRDFGGSGTGGFTGFRSGSSPRRDDDIIDLEAEEVYLVDDPIAEIEPPGERPA